MHVSSAVAPVVVEYMPLPQSVHVPGPVTDLYLQAAQAEQDASAVEAIVVEYLPVAQSVHASEPVSALYVPATQVIHSLPV